MPSPHSARLRKLIPELQAALAESKRLMFGEEVKHELGPRCSAAQLKALEKRFGGTIPPSYRAFLELHNGWENLAGDAKILAVEDHRSKWVKKRLDWLSVLFYDHGVDPIEKGATPLLLGPDARQFVLFDPAVRHKDGELELVDYDLVREVRRFPDLVKYLEHKLRVLQAVIKAETKDRATTEKSETVRGRRRGPESSSGTRPKSRSAPHKGRVKPLRRPTR